MRVSVAMISMRLDWYGKEQNLFPHILVSRATAKTEF
jgi:hypothetical protein